jgi:hypothetical protein
MYLTSFVTNGDEYRKVIKCHKKYFNSNDTTPEMEWLAEYLKTIEPFYDSEDVRSLIAPSFNFAGTVTFIDFGFLL